MRISVLGLAFCLMFAASAQAEVPVAMTMTCPVGGAKFDHVGYAAYSIYGARMDGKPSGSTSFPLRLAICPNGFIVLKNEKDYTREEKRVYARIIARAEFKALAKETSYYRAFYIAREGGFTPPADVAYLLLQATWEADTNPPLHWRYQEELIAYIDATLSNLGHDTLPYWYFQGYAANAERQTGQFDAALKRIEAIRANNPPEKMANYYEWSRQSFMRWIDTAEVMAKSGNSDLEAPPNDQR